jgi:hypothetical protein
MAVHVCKACGFDHNTVYLQYLLYGIDENHAKALGLDCNQGSP